MRERWGWGWGSLSNAGSPTHDTVFWFVFFLVFLVKIGNIFFPVLCFDVLQMIHQSNQSLVCRAWSAGDRLNTPQTIKRALGSWHATHDKSLNHSCSQVVFTLGIPGAGKSFCLRRRYDFSKIALVDLDEEMKKHPKYDATHPSLLYKDPEAYRWANDRTQERYEMLLRRRHPLIAVDGTGTHIDRQKVRIQMAKEGANRDSLNKPHDESRVSNSWSYRTILFHVHVPLQIALERNAKRSRQVPVDVMMEYDTKIREAVDILRDDVDEYILVDNCEEDQNHQREKWGNLWYLHTTIAPVVATEAQLLYEKTHGALKSSR